jgi:hypothetical protein
MKTIKYRISLFSEKPDALMKFYTEILRYKLVVSVDREDDYGFGIEIAPGYKLWVARHSEVHGKNKDSFRHMLSLYVDDIKIYFAAVKQFDPALIIEEPVLTCVGIPGEERWAGSFYDVDGNCVQMMQMTGN